jgi:uncharacterized membrane protein
MADFFTEYFISPIKYDTGYNIVNTLTYALILVVAVFLVYKLLQKMNIKIDRNFFVAVVPFIILGGLLRAVEDLVEHGGGWKPGFLILESATGVGRNILFITPLIYFVIFGLAIAALGIALALQKYKKIEYYKSWLVLGLIFCIIPLLFISRIDYNAVVMIAGITAAWALLFLGIKKLWKKEKVQKFLSRENIIIMTAHMFDATTTFVSIQFYPYWEQHVVAGFFISALGPAAMFLLKLPVVIAALYVIDSELKDDVQKNTFLKMAVLVLGLGPGVRNCLRLIMGV